jgi:hypothetical protein
MDKFVYESHIEKDREEELYCRLGQIRAQLVVIKNAMELGDISMEETDRRLEIVKQLLAWYVNGNNGMSWEQKLEELPGLFSMNEKIDLLSAFVICEKYVVKMQDMIMRCMDNDEGEGSGNSLFEVDEIKLRLTFILDLLNDYNVQTAYPHLFMEACEPNSWFS